MKLRKIKLSGFKSFVDPTAIQLQSNLTGIVGPNGCGKSNITDAMRWVMGEISAKQLRGESMHDVIFNGSSARKQVGKATAELIFDNSAGVLGGEYAKYAEIAIRREVNRDGFSDYFLNNTSCRRKDITNIFLGTGLGQNSYAVIEQGTISQFVEAKPDDLRIFIEEAAGISKYKERRKETENRIRHTKENLSRLNDILDELNKQLKHLKSQANAAERYKKLKQDERLTKAEVYTLHWRELSHKLLEHENIIKEKALELETIATDSHVLNAQINALREEHSDDLEKFNNIQADYYRLGANIARFEQQIKHTQERQEQLNKDLTQVDHEWQETLAHQTTDQNQIELLVVEKSKVESDIITSQALLQHAQTQLQQEEQQLQLWQKSWDDFNTNNAKILQALEVEQTRIDHLEHRLHETTQKIDKIKIELSSADFSAVNAEVENLNLLFNKLQGAQEHLNQEISGKKLQIATKRENVNQMSSELDQIRHKLQTLMGRKSSLEALQQAALGKNDADLTGWLKKYNLAEHPRLAQMLDVVPGWETAVETVLGVYLEAVCIKGMSDVAVAINGLTRGNLTLFDQTQTATSTARLEITPLVSKIKSNLALSNLLSGIYVADDLNEALVLQKRLNHNESIITKSGVWLGSSWLRVAYDVGPKTGILQREKELNELYANIVEVEHNALRQEQELSAEKKSLSILEEEYQNLQQKLQDLMVEYSQTQSQIAAKTTYTHHLAERALALKSDLSNEENNLENAKEQLITAQTNRGVAAQQKLDSDLAKQDLIALQEELQNKLIVAREYAQKMQQDSSSLNSKLQLIQTQLDYLNQSIERASKRLSGLQEHRLNIEKTLAEVIAPVADFERDLQLELEQRLVVENELTLAKQKTSGIEQTLRELEQKYSLQQEVHEKLRVFLEKLRTEREGLQVRSSTYNEQVLELGYQVVDLNAQIDTNATISEWDEKLTNVGAKIERLGLINLAAIEEFEKLSERKNYLDAQNQDLLNALNTLEDVIRKIDHDTQERFKTAYESINQKFQELFPKIFNGGKAYLEQTADNLLETGVLIMAQPPGKRNSSIHLLSGGEKALTAIALIFSIFHLTPAPFCILDEVDAPLDDLNVLRFCNLVKEMAQTIQFIFITHNKLTMEIADQLIGVTMQEPGVSRIVSVDIDTAISLAEKSAAS